MMDTEEKYKVVIIDDDERSASDALRRELEPYREFEIKGIASSGKGKKMIWSCIRIYSFLMWSFRIYWDIIC